MLVLTRRKGESIAIGDNIQIQVLSVKGGQVRIGVSAPKEIAINREERIVQNKAANSASNDKAAEES